MFECSTQWLEQKNSTKGQVVRSFRLYNNKNKSPKIIKHILNKKWSSLFWSLHTAWAISAGEKLPKPVLHSVAATCPKLFLVTPIYQHARPFLLEPAYVIVSLWRISLRHYMVFYFWSSDRNRPKLVVHQDPIRNTGTVHQKLEALWA